MRELVDADRIRAFMRALAAAAKTPAQVYLVGGSTAVLEGWRASTVDIDLKLVPEDDTLLRAIPVIKETLRVNVELASPDGFIPVKDGWQDRSPFVAQEGRLTFRHFDPYAQALAKIERGHRTDLIDVTAFIDRGLVDPEKLAAYFDAVADRLHRYPAVDAASFRRAVEAVVADARRRGKN